MIYLILLMLVLMPNLVWAADLFTPVSTDLSMKVLAALFGKLEVFGTSSSDSFIAVFGAFNGVVLTIGGLLAAYTILAGTLGTAHDGEMLGKKFSSVWIPIRTALGTALVLPVVSGGYCVMQLVVGWVVVQGIGLADYAWSTYMSASNVSKIVTVGMEKPAVNELAWNSFGSLVCMRGYEKIYKASQERSSGMWNNLNFGMTTEVNAGSTIIKFGSKNQEMGFFKNSCGSLSIAKQDPLPASVGTGEFSMMGDLSFLNKELSSADTKHLEAVKVLVADIDEAAKAFVANTSLDISPQIQAASVKYQTSTKEAAAGIVEKLGDFKQLEKSATKDGWMLAGAYYMRLTYLSETAQKAVAKTPTASGISGSVSTLFKDQFQSEFVKPLQELKEKSGGEFGVASASEGQSNFATSGEAGSWDWLKSGAGFDTVIKNIFKAESMIASSSNEHPIMAMKRVGNWAAITGGAIFTKYVLGMGLIGTAQGSGTAVAIATLPLAMIIFPTLMLLSFMLSYVLPMMPFLIWIGMCLGWVVLVAEAIVAAPIWAVMHMTAQGDDMTGSGRKGYSLVLSLMLRPVLMIFGLIFSLTIITVFGQVINMIFFEVFMLSQQDSNLIIWVIGLLAAPLIYCGVVWTVIKKSLDIIHILPDNILNWFGGGGQQLGSYGNAIGGHGSSTYAAVGALGNISNNSLNALREAGSKGQGGSAGNLGNEPLVSAPKDMPLPTDISNPSLGEKAIEQSSSSPETLEGQKISSKLDKGFEALGGAGSKEGQAFNENMNKDLDEGKDFEKSFSSNIQSGLDEKFGAGAGSFVSSETNEKFEGAGLAQSVEKLNQVASHYSSKGYKGDEIKDKSSKLFQAATNQFNGSKNSIANGGEKNLTDYVDKALNFSQGKELGK